MRLARWLTISVLFVSPLAACTGQPSQPTSAVLTPQPIKCGDPSALTGYPSDPSWKGVRIGSLFFSAFGPGNAEAVITGFAAGSPTKVVIEPTQPLAAALRLEGWRCATGERLRFEYGASWNTPVAALPPAGTADNGRPVGYTGYMLFTAPGKYMISVSSKDGHLIGSAVFSVET